MFLFFSYVSSIFSFCWYDDFFSVLCLFCLFAFFAVTSFEMDFLSFFFLSPLSESGHAPVSVASPSFGGAIVFTSDCSGSRLSGCTLEGNTAINGVGGDLAVLAAPSGR